jgi:PhnB protein
MATRPIPAGYEAAIPYLCVRGGAAALDFYQRAFDASPLFHLAMPDGRIGHAEFLIGAARLMLSDEFPDFDSLGPLSIGGTPVTVHLYTPDVDAFVQRAAKAGARILRPPEDHFYGDRSAKLEDPFGHRWHIATRMEDMSPEEMQRRASAAFASQ